MIRLARSSIPRIFSLLSTLRSLFRGLLRIAITRVVDEMSFGIGIGDFIKVVEIAHKVSSQICTLHARLLFSPVATQGPPCFQGRVLTTVDRFEMQSRSARIQGSQSRCRLDANCT
jgi:hypothetical protein